MHYLELWAPFDPIRQFLPLWSSHVLRAFVSGSRFSLVCVCVNLLPVCLGHVSGLRTVLYGVDICCCCRSMRVLVLHTPQSSICSCTRRLVKRRLTLLIDLLACAMAFVTREMLRAGALPRLEPAMYEIAGILPADYMLSIPLIYLHHRKTYRIPYPGY